MTVTKEFPTLHVLSAVTGMLMVDSIGPVYEVLNWMTGESLFTHQLPRVSREARAVMKASHPELAAAFAEAEKVNRENVHEWAALWLDRYGPTIAVPKMTADQHERIEPLSELAEKVHPSKIMVVGR